MGIVYFSIPQRVALWLRSRASVNTFIETGTHLGGTTLWAAQNFGRVISIEADETLPRRLGKNCKPAQMLTCDLGEAKRNLDGRDQEGCRGRVRSLC